MMVRFRALITKSLFLRKDRRKPLAQLAREKSRTTVFYFLTYNLLYRIHRAGGDADAYLDYVERQIEQAPWYTAPASPGLPLLPSDWKSRWKATVYLYLVFLALAER